jgi:hypothetical protein
VFTRAPGHYHDSAESNTQSKSFAVLIHFNNITDLLKAFLGKGSVNSQHANMEDYLSGRVLLRVARQQRTNEDAG